MGKEISRIRLNRLYSESNIFEEISFHDGVNIILGEKYDDSSVKGRKTNGVGKSMSIEFLDFGFLNDYEKSRIAKIPKEVDRKSTRLNSSHTTASRMPSCA